MRSRPDLELRITSPTARPGDTVHFELTLIGKTDTPVDDVRFTVRGVETRSAGEDTVTREYVDTTYSLGAHPLAAGERKALRGQFTLPLGLPPSFDHGATRIAYTIQARVDIPWWPDRVTTWGFRVAATPTSPKPKSGLFSNTPDGPRGDAVSLEVAIENTELPLGDTVRGAVALWNARRHGVEQLDVRLLGSDEPVGRGLGSGSPFFESHIEVLGNTAPIEGHSYPFALRLPDVAPASFTAAYSRAVWRVEARAVIRWGSNVVLAPEVTVHATGSGVSDAQAPVETKALRQAPPVGSERRALIWSDVAERVGLACDTQAERMTGTFGQVQLSIAFELREGTLWPVATAEWPELRLDAELRERRWRDALSTARLGDTLFDHRFAARARDAAQLEALLSPAVRQSLLAFERVTLDDDGALLASSGGHNFDQFERFVRAATAAAKALDESIDAIPSPRGLADCRAAWEAFAQKVGGTFAPGDCSIRDVSVRGSAVELVTRFADEAEPMVTAARVLLPAGTRVEPLPPEAERVLASLSRECEGVRVAPDAVEALLPCPLPNPERAELLWRTLQRLAAAIAAG